MTPSDDDYNTVFISNLVASFFLLYIIHRDSTYRRVFWQGRVVVAYKNFIARNYYGAFSIVQKTRLTKRLMKGKVVSSFLLGAKELYGYVDYKRNVKMMNIGYVNNQYVIAKTATVVPVNSAVKIDLIGQICSDSMGIKVISGIGGQLGFVRGASMSEGCVSITAFSSPQKADKVRLSYSLNPVQV